MLSRYRDGSRLRIELVLSEGKHKAYVHHCVLRHARTQHRPGGWVHGGLYLLPSRLIAVCSVFSLCLTFSYWSWQMAKRKRSRKALPPTAGKPLHTKPKEKPLYDGGYVDALDPPNHLLALEALPEAARAACGSVLSRKYRWPLTSATTGRDEGGIFVHACHGAEHWNEWADHPPTWMDPHLFVDMAEADPRVQRILRVAYKKNDREGWKHLVSLFEQIFDEQYLPLMLEKFAEEAVPLLAQWLLRNYAQKELDAQQASKKRKQ